MVDLYAILSCDVLPNLEINSLPPSALSDWPIYLYGPIRGSVLENQPRDRRL